MTTKAFVYTELQISLPFADAAWRELNPALLAQPGLVNKTWLAGVGSNSVGGFYAFDSIDNALAFATGYFPGEAERIGVAHTTRVFDAGPVEEASRDMGSPHFGAGLPDRPGAFLYTELQTRIPFETAPWRDRNPVLKTVPGLLAKTWLSGIGTGTLGGFDAFDTLENARAFALEAFPGAAAEPLATPERIREGLRRAHVLRAAAFLKAIGWVIGGLAAKCGRFSGGACPRRP